MDLLAGLAARFRDAAAANDSPVDPDDLLREDVDSDVEIGPEDPDAEDDALPPGGYPEDDPMDVAPVAAETVAEPPVVAAVPLEPAAPAAATCPPLPSNLNLLTVPKLREQLKWRGLDTSGLKAALHKRLKDAVQKSVPILDSLPEAPAAGPAPRQRSAAAVEEQAALWEPIDVSQIDRPVWTGPEESFEPAPDLGLKSSSHPKLYLDSFYDAGDRREQVTNSIRYRGWLKLNDNNTYAHAPDMTVKLNALAHATLLLQGLSPVPSQRDLHRVSFALKGHRAADLLTRDEWLVWKAHFHISNPQQAPKFGTPAWDELHKVRPLLEKILQRSLNNVAPGKKASLDEITIGFQGHHARLKQRCGKFKNAGDGFQVLSERNYHGHSCEE